MKASHKYDLYEKAVQCPEVECAFALRVYKKHQKKSPKIFREDFCSSFINAIHWVQMNPDHKAYALDNALAPLKYGSRVHIPKLTEEEQGRLGIYQMDVRSTKAPKSDIIMASNFSWLIFKTREELKAYFKACHQRLNKNGMMIMDMLGGSDCHEPNVEVDRRHHFTYYWEQYEFNPITHDAKFAIHFKEPGQKKRVDVFQYDWRLWSIPEAVEILKEAGFSDVHVYWEDDDEDGDGNGNFRPQKRVESCASWVAYLAACK